MQRIEKYKCSNCGTEFTITDKDRMTTFIHRHFNEWTCPKCSNLCYALKTQEK